MRLNEILRMKCLAPNGLDHWPLGLGPKASGDEGESSDHRAGPEDKVGLKT